MAESSSVQSLDRAFDLLELLCKKSVEIVKEARNG